MLRQVPRYLIIGNGRVARHFRYYFTLLDIPFSSWHRQQSITQLQPLVSTASHILILISEAAVDDFAKRYLSESSAIKIHFSGCLVSTEAFGVHPLMSFTHNLYDLEKYQTIPFVLDAHAPEFAELLPGLANSHARISMAQKAKYHALCVLSGNFSCMLWQKFMRDLEIDLQLPKSFAQPYLSQLTENLINCPETALTGPLVRNDQTTIKHNIAALAGDPFQAVYESFVKCYQQLKEKENEYS